MSLFGTFGFCSRSRSCLSNRMFQRMKLHGFLLVIGMTQSYNAKVKVKSMISSLKWHRLVCETVFPIEIFVPPNVF
jgi:hypothetical protein